MVNIMACYHLLKAWYSKEINPTGKRSLVFDPKYALEPEDTLDIPCGQCWGCRLERSRQWAMRCIHESQMHDENCFITLTFSPEGLARRNEEFMLQELKDPDSVAGWSPIGIHVRDLQLFMKRLRKHYSPRKIRYFQCGEYGDLNMRPHYHSILFGIDFADKYHWRTNNGYRCYRSETLEKLWPYGQSEIGSVTFESAAYVARYIMKKITGDIADDHYTIVDEDDIDFETGEIKTYKIHPEFVTMSRRPGIGFTWFEQFKSDVYPKDFVTVNGKKMKPPKYYDKLLDLLDPDELSYLKDARADAAMVFSDNNEYDRLLQREAVVETKMKRLPRDGV
jgi:hypothetical protein